MFSYIKRYPISLAIIVLVIYLSFFKPPSVPQVELFPHADKIVHMGMYFVMSGMLWWEFFRGHRGNGIMRHAWIGAFVCPVLFSGCIELMQEYCTNYRGGDWLDFLANTTGALLASLLAVFIKKRYKRTAKESL